MTFTTSATLTFIVFFASATVEAQETETIAEILVHGNHTTPDADVLAFIGLRVGEPASEGRLREAEARLHDSGRFANVELRRRHRSIDNPSEILVIILVDERAAVREHDLIPGRVARLRNAAMWLPILNHADGYGFTYGARASVVDTLGHHSRLSVPLTWGGERRAALEVERAFDGPISVVRGALSANRRVNPHFGLEDVREGARLEADRIVTGWLRVGAAARVERVAFGPSYLARHSAGGVHAVLDTRIDPSFPRNAVHARFEWERIAFETGDAGRWTTDARGYVGIGGSAVLALRAQLAGANAPLPFAEQSLLGGSGSLRGYPTGHHAGDGLAAVSAEVRYPLTSPLRVGRVGVKAFVDAGTVWKSRERLRDQRFERGVGGGVFLGAAAIVMDLDVGWPEEGKPRAHFGLGVSF